MVRLVKHDRPRARNYLSRREQWRLLLLFVPLGLVIIAMGKLRDPNFAGQINRFFTEPTGAKQASAVNAVANVDSTEMPSTQQAPPSVEKPVQPGAFRSETTKTNVQPTGEPAVEITPSAGLFPGVEAERLAAIRDNTYFRNAEKDVWFHFLDIVRQTPAKVADAAHSIQADYVQLVDQPHFYRGKLLKVYGYVQQVTEQTPAPNNLGIAKYYRVVVQPTDGSQWPIFVYILELPPGLSVGESASAGGYMSLTGLFFKNLSYPWSGGVGIAPVIVAKSFDYSASVPCAPGISDIHPPVASDAWKKPEQSSATDPSKADESSTSFREVLKLAGWDVEQLAKLDDGEPLSDDQRVTALELLRRLRSFSSESLDAWVHDGLEAYDMLKSPGDYRGQLVRLSGRITSVKKHAPDAELAERLEMPEYFECEIVLDKSAGTSTILTTRVPKQWLQAEKVDEPASAVALYAKRVTNGDPPSATWLAKEIAWHPGKATGADIVFGSTVGELNGAADKLLGKVVLGNLGMDVGLLDQVQSRGKIRPEEREAFYQMLSAVGQIGVHQLGRIAEQNLPAVRQEWESTAKTDGAKPRRALAQEVMRQVGKGRYSVAPLFNDASNQIGRLFVFDGIARRAVRVEVGTEPDGGGPSDVARRFGVDHYYEMYVFTGDSQNYPLVFTVRELPAGFPTGDSIHVPVRVAGFFFKDWLYHTRGGSAADDDTVAAGPVDRAQYTPLLIGRAPLFLATEASGSKVLQYVAGGIFLLALAGIFAATTLYARSDRRFRERRAANLSLPASQSLNELNLPEPAASVNFPIGAPPRTGDSG